MPKPGPRPKPRSTKQSKPVTVLFTPGEARAIRQVAEGQPVSSWIRARILEVLEGAPQEETLLDQARAIQGQIQEQMAKTEKHVAGQLREIEEVRAEAARLVEEAKKTMAQTRKKKP